MDKIIVETFRDGGKQRVNYVEIDGVRYHPSYGNLLNLGFMPVDTSFFRGYVSRRINIREALVNVAVRRPARGELYVEIPNWESTRYSIRQYLWAPAPLVFREYQE